VSALLLGFACYRYVTHGATPLGGLRALLAAREGSRTAPPVPPLTPGTLDDGMTVATFNPAQLATFLTGIGLEAPARPLDALESELAERIRSALAAVAHDPSAESFGRLGQLFDFIMRDDLAESCYAEAARRDPSDHRWPHYRGRLAERAASLEAAERLLRTALELEPQSVGTQWQLAHVLEQLDRDAEAEEILRKSTRGAAGQPHPWTELARIALRRKDAPAAIKLAREALAQQPDDSGAHEVASRAFAAIGSTTEAEWHRRRVTRGVALDSVPDPLAQQLLEVSDSVLFHRAKAQYFSSIGDWEQVATAMAPVVRRDPGNIDDQLILAEAFLRSGRPDDAQKTAEAALARRPGSARCRSMLAEIALEQQDFARAERLAAEATALDDSLNRAHALRTTALAALGRHVEALPHAQRSLELDATNASNHALVGWMLMEIGRWTEAEAVLRAGLEVDPENPMCGMKLAELQATRR
jgi:tetratricopeptide (TPR) repeat protein